MNHSRTLNFDRLTGYGVKVAVVDSGIDALHPQVAGFIRGVDLSLSASGEVRTGVAVTDRAGHGTACAGIIRTIAPAVELYSVRIMDESLRADGRLLIAGIAWAIEHDMDVVNLSLGTTEGSMRQDLHDVCDRAAKAGIIVVAAMANRAAVSYPAGLETVISVGSRDLPGRYDYVYQHGCTPQCLARGNRQRLHWAGGKQVWMGGNSFAAPRIAAVVALIRERFPGLSLSGVREILRHNSLMGAAQEQRTECPPTTKPPAAPAYGWINRAILFPFSKEMHAFIRYSDLLKFEVVGIVDLPLRGEIGKDAGEAIEVKPSGVQIVSHITRVSAAADTLILGYVGELGRLRGEDVVAKWLGIALQQRLNVFSFQSLADPAYEHYLQQAQELDLRFMAPEVPAAGEDVLPQRLSLEAVDISGDISGDVPVDVPVVGVFGTSSSQGKLTLQLALRRTMSEWGYRVGQIGTEPHAQLLGMDLAFPMGHASTVNLPLGAYPEYLDRKLRELCKRLRPDLIIAGSQSGTIPFDLNDPRTLALPSLSFLLGIKPDACVLVVNGVDAESYIRHTIEAIGAIGKCPVLALAVSDRRKSAGNSQTGEDKISDTEMAHILHRLESHFAIAAVSITSQAGIRRLAESIKDQFSRPGHTREPENTSEEEAIWSRKRA